MNHNHDTMPRADFNNYQIGDALGGGYYSGLIRIGDDTHALIVSPREHGEFNSVRLLGDAKPVPGADSFADGLANTRALAEAGSELAAKVLALEINGVGGWAIPARDQLELLYRNHKPTTEENWCSYRDGENPSSVPFGGLYTEDSPAQTGVEAFRDDGSEAFSEAWHWSSTFIPASSGAAFSQDFFSGHQGYDYSFSRYRARAVRTIKLI